MTGHGSFMKTGTKHEVDIAIVGAGVAGCTAAIALAESFNVVLIDKLKRPVERIGECLAPAARRILRRLDLLDGLEKISESTQQGSHLKNIGTQSYWGSDQVHIVDHLRNPDGFGWHLDRQAFEIYLRETALQRGVNCYWPAKLEAAHYENFRWHLTVTQNTEASSPQTCDVSANFVIDASGRQSQFARKLGIQRIHFDKLIACWATMANNEQNKMGTVSASELGWWYSAPLPNNKRVLALHTDSDLVNRAAIKDSGYFIELAQANREMAKILERNQREIEYHKTVAANSSRLLQVAGQQWAALGDAAMSFDPLSSQGMFTAMAGSLQLTALIIESGFMQYPNSIKMKRFQINYASQIDQIWQLYAEQKKMFYGEEMRWKDSVFWKKRH